MAEDIFADVVAASGGFFVDAAVAAGHQLGLFAVLAREGARELEGLVERLIPTRRGHRLRALLDVLVAVGVLERRGRAVACAAVPARVAPPPAAGWGRLAEVIVADAPLSAAGETAAYHLALARSGAAPAAELAARLPAGGLIDLGGGRGTYAAAYLVAHPVAAVTLVERPEVAALARAALAGHGARVTIVEGDAATVAVGAGHAVALLANLLHVHDAAAAAALCAAAARAVAPAGLVVVKDLAIEDDRGGPWPSLLFALNMALYTDGGDVHPTPAILGWLAAAGLEAAVAPPLAASPGHVVVIGRRPAAPAPRAP